MNSEYRKELVVALFYMDKGIANLKAYINTRTEDSWTKFILSGLWMVCLDRLIEISSDSIFDKILDEYIALDPEIEKNLEPLLFCLYRVKQTLIEKAKEFPPQISDVEHSQELINYLPLLFKEAFHEDTSTNLL